ncbi:uncharacterized protein DEA37_0005106 [Paragonimus westermani]|uniref:Reverse transcriptase/retrotransposon-derived protein RNase H-like domain-containing protein n=1 Tax=Paragonimus westermani TaxID=34504 RepID=A0A5J4NIG9_9TREM|nr:uncharacterized protein DEA37_0005106 [Paragonimus westermani]
MDDLKLLDQPVNSICNQTKLHSRSETLLLAPGSQRQIEELKIWYASAFEPGLGLCTEAKATHILNPGVKPVFRPERSVQYAAIPIVEGELDRLQTESIIQSVNYSEWAAPIVVIKKAHGGIASDCIFDWTCATLSSFTRHVASPATITLLS